MADNQPELQWKDLPEWKDPHPLLLSLEDAAVSRGSAATRGSSAAAMIPEPTEPVGKPPEGYKPR